MKMDTLGVERGGRVTGVGTLRLRLGLGPGIQLGMGLELGQGVVLRW